MQTICTLLQTDNHINTSSVNCYRPDALPDAQPTVSKHWRTKPSLRLVNFTRTDQGQNAFFASTYSAVSSHSAAGSSGSRAAGETAAADCLAIHTQRSVTRQPRQPATVSLLSNATHTSLSSWVVSASDSGVRGSRFESRRWQLCLSRQLLRYTVLGTGCAPLLQCLGRLRLPPFVGR